MTLPPAVIHIKRRRGDDPVDTLLIESESQADDKDNDDDDYERRKRRFTDYAFSRLRQNGTLPNTDNKSQHDRARYEVPTVEVRETRRGDDRPIEGLLKTKSDDSAKAKLSPQNPAYLEIAKHIANARRFHLSRTPHSHDSAQPVLDGGSLHAGGIRKRKRGNRHDPVVFQEYRPSSKIRKTLDNGRTSKTRISPDADNDGARDASTTLRKRPIASAAEKKWRAEQWSKETPAKKQDTREKDEARDLQLAKELEAFTLAETGAATKDTPTPNPPSQRRSILKYQPKPQLKQRNKSKPDSKAEADDNVLETHSVSDDSDYVIDTYVRQPLESLPQLPKLELDQNMTLNVGLIVLTEEDQLFLDDYDEADNEDDEWDSEDEDSNAENNPANDYPEDEIASDDEYDCGAYQYRQGASDDEQFDSEDDWNDDDAPWKPNFLER